MHEAIQKMFDLSGQVAMIAGGARDLGLDMATVLGQAGADLVITSRSQDSASQAAARLSETPTRRHSAAQPGYHQAG